MDSVTPRRCLQLQEVPLIAVQVFEDSDCAVGLFARRPYELYFARGHFAVVAPKIVGVQKKKDSPAGLVANPTHLLGRCRPGQKQASALRARRSDQYPSPLFAQTSIFDHSEVERASEECERFIVVADDQRDMAQGLHRRWPLL